MAQVKPRWLNANTKHLRLESASDGFDSTIYKVEVIDQTRGFDLGQSTTITNRLLQYQVFEFRCVGKTLTSYRLPIV